MTTTRDSRGDPSRARAAPRAAGRSWLPLVAACTAGCLAEAVTVALALPVPAGGSARAAGLSTPALALAPQAAAPQPFAAFHDLRWLLLLRVSPAAFAFVVAALLAARAVLSAWLLRLAWPTARAAPTWRLALRTAAAFTLTCTALCLLFAGLDYATAVASVSWLTFASVPAVLILAVLAARGVTALRWWALRWSGRAALAMVAGFAGWSVAGAAAAAAPGWLAVVAAGCGGGVVDAMTWRALARTAAAEPAPATRRVPAVALVAGFAAVVVTGTTIGFHLTRLHPVLRPTAAPSAAGVPVLVASGFGTPWDGTPPHYLGAGFSEWRYSYAGLDASGLPRPFLGPQTYAPLPVLVARMAREVAAIHARTGRPVDLVAESEGALVATAYLHATPGAPVERVVLLSPLLSPGRADPRQDSPVTPWLLHVLSHITRGLGSEQIQADDPVLRSIAAHGAALRSLLRCPVGGVAQLAVLPLADATSTAYGGGAGPAMPSDVVVGVHGGLLARSDVDRLAAGFLRTGRVPPSPLPRWLRPAVQALAAGWQQPSGGAGATCAATDRALRGWLAGS